MDTTTSYLKTTTYLLTGLILIAACSSIERVGSVGAGGGAAGGSGGGGEHALCVPDSGGCVRSCDYPTLQLEPQSCDAQGNPYCPLGQLLLFSCDPNACAQMTNWCCDDTTGDVGPPPCGPDGLGQACPEGSHASDVNGCIPSSLGVSSCGDLVGQACTLLGQHCGVCSCGTADGGAYWSCTHYL